MPQLTDTPFLGERFDRALVLAHALHHRQVRKGTEVPYVSHLLGVAALVLEHGGDEDHAIAGLLHDALEDAPGRIDGPGLEDRFGPEVRRIVEGCTDREDGDGPRGPEGWLQRKQAHLLHLEAADPRVLLVTAADKLHNLRSLVADVRAHGPGYLDRFNAPDRASTVWYYRAMADVLERRLGGPMPVALTEGADELATLVGQATGRAAQPAPGAL